MGRDPGLIGRGGEHGIGAPEVAGHLAATRQVQQSIGADIEAVRRRSIQPALCGGDRGVRIPVRQMLLAAQRSDLAPQGAHAPRIRRHGRSQRLGPGDVEVDGGQAVAKLVDPGPGEQQVYMRVDGARRELAQPAFEPLQLHIVQELVAVPAHEVHGRRRSATRQRIAKRFVQQTLVFMPAAGAQVELGNFGAGARSRELLLQHLLEQRMIAIPGAFVVQPQHKGAVRFQSGAAGPHRDLAAPRRVRQEVLPGSGDDEVAQRAGEQVQNGRTRQECRHLRRKLPQQFGTKVVHQVAPAARQQVWQHTVGRVLPRVQGRQAQAGDPALGALEQGF